MLRIKSGFLTVSIALVWLLSMSGCAKKPTESEIPMAEPETSITSIVISSGKTIVYAKGVDSDGLVEDYSFKVDGGEWTPWQKSSVYELEISYSAWSEQHTIEVRSRDNDGNVDASPAKLAYSPKSIGTFNQTPETSINAPVSGATTSTAVAFSWGGVDPDGSILGYLYKVDAGGWQQVGADVRSATVSGLSEGPHVFTVKSKDNLGLVDPTPSSVSFTVRSGLPPELAITEGPTEGATFFVAAGSTSEIRFGWEARVDYYYGKVRGYSYKFPQDAEWLPVSEDLQGATFTLGASDEPYTISIRAVDEAGTEVEQDVSFYVVTPTMDQGILLVNGIHWGSYSDGSATEFTGDPWEMYEGRALFGNHEVDFWDAFAGGPAEGYPSTLGDPIGTGPLSGAVLGRYSTLIWVANSFQGDDEVWNASKSLVKSYLNVGGNLILATRNAWAYEIMDDDLTEYGYIASTGETVTIGSGDLLVAKVDGLVDMGVGNGETSSSLAQFCEVEDSPYVTVLFEFSATGEVAGLIAEPPEGKGKFVFIGGRPYRFDVAASAANYDYILTHYLNEQ